ncbi:MAG TPA: OsmC family protein [Anaerolineales bacterium]
MDANVKWEKDLQFTGMADSGFAVRMDSHPSAETGTSPVEMVVMALAGCTAMDVISILRKQRQEVSSFDVKVHAERTSDYPRVITSAILEYVVVGRDVAETALVTAIDRSLQKYCPVHAMLKKAFSIETRYSIFEVGTDGQPLLIKEGAYVE